MYLYIYIYIFLRLVIMPWLTKGGRAPTIELMERGFKNKNNNNNEDCSYLKLHT